jgi:hypothetical protein
MAKFLYIFIHRMGHGKQGFYSTYDVSLVFFLRMSQLPQPNPSPVLSSRPFSSTVHLLVNLTPRPPPPDVPAMMAAAPAALTYRATPPPRQLGFDFRALLPPLFEDAVRAFVSGALSTASLGSPTLL